MAVLASTNRRRGGGPRPPATAGTRVAIVTRISTDEVNQPYSLEAQSKGLEAFVASQPGQAITHRFVDQASGATLERPGLQAALAAAKAGEFDVLLVYRIDRLTRSIVGLMTIVSELDAAGVALRSATEPIDTQGPVGRMLLQLLGIFAEFERGLLIDRITKGFERKAARGEWLGGPGPYGYHLDSATKTLVPEPPEAAIVGTIFAKYVEERLGAASLSSWLNDSGHRSRHDRLWTNQTVLRVLRNAVYVGKIAHGDDLHDGKHEAIIDEGLFARAQKLLDQRAARSTTIRPTTSPYLLSGKLRCQVCGGAYVGTGAHGRNGFYRYYVCRTRQKTGGRGCSSQRLPADDLEGAITEALVSTYGDYDLLARAARDAFAHARDEQPRLEAELAGTESQLRETSAAIDRYLRAFEVGSMSDTLCAPRIVELSERRTELTARRDELSVQVRASAPQLPSATQMRVTSEQLRRAMNNGSPDVVKQVIDELVDRIDISSDKQAQPYFRVPDVKRPGPLLARACGTPVRMGPQHVEVLGRYSNHSDQGERLQGLIEMASSGRPKPKTRTTKQVHRRLRPDEMDPPP
ncbi:MAG TPA: recombinase family protein, partial [Acidimicrobiales bacterium]|nr:recombinase family protein [Acidimicrobiales bacterium]